MFLIDDINNNTTDFFSVKKAKTLFYHPLYNVTAKKNKGINEFYDYDVALIQLEKYVVISTNVR